MEREIRFAEDMSTLLFEMRIEDINGSTLTDNEGQVIPDEFINNIIDDENHIPIIKKRIYEAVLAAVIETPNKFYHISEGIYSYTAETYDFSYEVDLYVEEQFMHTQTKCVHICTHCQSDNVAVTAWVKPNEGYKFLSELENPMNGQCFDCNLPSIVETVSLKKSAKVIGFQVVGEDGTPEAGGIHPHMDASFCVYSLEQARSMIDDNDNDNESWRLLTIWEGDVEEPTMMYTGLPR